MKLTSGAHLEVRVKLGPGCRRGKEREEIRGREDISHSGLTGRQRGMDVWLAMYAKVVKL